jgi:hypothetical protein
MNKSHQEVSLIFVRKIKTTDPLSINKIKEISQEIRKIYHIDDKDYFPIYDILDKLYVKGKIGIQILENDSPLLESDTPAKYNASNNFIYIKENVFNEWKIKIIEIISLYFAIFFI